VQIVLEHVRVNRPNLTEIHCLREENVAVSHALETLTGKPHLPIDISGDQHCVYITDGLTMEEAEALLIGLRKWKLKPEQITRDRLQSVITLEGYWQRLQARQHVLNLEDDQGLDAYDYADAEAGE
jgi:ethanolamine utilization protein EutQ (cupin superfamily)